MYKNGFTAEQMAAATDNDIEDIAAIIKGMANSKKLSQWLHNPYTGEEIEITATTENALNNKCEKQIKAWEKEQAEWERQQYVEDQKQYVQQMDEENWQLIQNLRRHMLSYIVRWSSYRYLTY